MASSQVTRQSLEGVLPLDSGVQTRGPHTRIVAIFCELSARALEMKNLEYSRVKRGYQPLEPRTRLLATREILRVSATLHLSCTVVDNSVRLKVIK